VVAFAPAFALLAAGAAGGTIMACEIGDAGCLESLPVLGCGDADDGAVETCRIVMDRLERQSDAGWRDATRMLALAYRVRADRTGAGDAAASHDRDRSVALYRGLVASDPSDTEAVFGLAGAVEDEAERIRLRRQYVAMSPDTVLGRRLLAQELFENGAGAPAAALEAGRLMEEAYARHPGAHKWWLAGNAIHYYGAAGEHGLATALKARVIEDLDVDDLAGVSLASEPAEAGRVLAIVCDSYLVEAVGPGKCLLNLDRAESFLASAVRDDRARQVADFAAQAMVQVARAESALCPELVGRIDRIAALGFASPAVRASRDRVRELEGSIVVE
jgi:hypothetical protein